LAELIAHKILAMDTAVLIAIVIAIVIAMVIIAAVIFATAFSAISLVGAMVTISYETQLSIVSECI
jgi:uncharacterized membrane protein